MMLKIATLTEKLREQLGTPFHHAGRVKNVGVDCGGMVIVALRELGYEIYDKPKYNRKDGLEDMVEVLQKNNFLQKKPNSSDHSKLIRPGDLILIRTTDIYHHLVYYTEDDTIIHAWVTTGVNKVVETTMLPDWYSHIHSIWRFKELED